MPGTKQNSMRFGVEPYKDVGFVPTLYTHTGQVYAMNPSLGSKSYGEAFEAAQIWASKVGK